MPHDTMAIPPEAREVADRVADLLGDGLLGLYLHGSAMDGGLRPQSDIDLLAIVTRPLREAERARLAATLLRLSGRHPARPGGPRCIEMLVVLRSDLAGPGAPTRAEFLYGEWLRDIVEAGRLPQPGRDPEITLVLAQARERARPLVGPAATELISAISPPQIRQAMRDGLPRLIDSLSGDERNVLLTLARMWRTATMGDFLGKDVAAAWAVTAAQPRLPAAVADTLTYARAAYRGDLHDDWTDRQVEALHAADCLHQRVVACL
jgi:streptomycin 3"-adenylyltransferase